MTYLTIYQIDHSTQNGQWVLAKWAFKLDKIKWYAYQNYQRFSNQIEHSILVNSLN
jgi:hypothetical protein